MKSFSDPGLAVGRRIAAVMFLGGIGGGIVFPIIPILGIQLGLSGAFIGLILGANRVTRFAANPLAGALVDRYGGKWPLAVGLLFESLATLTYSLALHVEHAGWWLLFGRAAWGIGSALLIVGGYTAVLNVSLPANRGRLTAFVRTSMSLGMPAGLVIGGIVAGIWSDNLAFLTAAFLSFGGAALALFTVPRSRSASMGLGRVAVEAAREAIEPGSFNPGPGDSSLRRPATTPAGLPPSGREAAPATSWLTRMFADRRIVMIWVYNLITFFALQGALLATLVLFVQQRRLDLFGLGAQPSAGMLMAVMMLWSAGISLLVGRLLDRTALRTTVVPPAIGALIVGFALLAMAHTLPIAILALVFLGTGMGGTTVPLMTLLGDATEEETRGRAISIYRLFGDAGGGLGPILGIAAAVRYGYAATYLALAAVLLLASPLAVSLLRDEQRRAAQGSTAAGSAPHEAST